MDGRLELFYVEKPTKYISTLQAQNKLDNKFMTLDIETRVEEDTRRDPYSGALSD